MARFLESLEDIKLRKEKEKANSVTAQRGRTAAGMMSQPLVSPKRTLAKKARGRSVSGTMLNAKAAGKKAEGSDAPVSPGKVVGSQQDTAERNLVGQTSDRKPGGAGVPGLKSYTTQPIVEASPAVAAGIESREQLAKDAQLAQKTESRMIGAAESTLRSLDTHKQRVEALQNYPEEMRPKIRGAQDVMQTQRLIEEGKIEDPDEVAKMKMQGKQLEAAKKQNKAVFDELGDLDTVEKYIKDKGLTAEEIPDEYRGRLEARQFKGGGLTAEQKDAQEILNHSSTVDDFQDLDAPRQEAFINKQIEQHGEDVVKDTKVYKEYQADKLINTPEEAAGKKRKKVDTKTANVAVRDIHSDARAAVGKLTDSFEDIRLVDASSISESQAKDIYRDVMEDPDRRSELKAAGYKPAEARAKKLEILLHAIDESDLPGGSDEGWTYETDPETGVQIATRGDQSSAAEALKSQVKQQFRKSLPDAKRRRLLKQYNSQLKKLEADGMEGTSAARRVRSVISTLQGPGGETVVTGETIPAADEGDEGRKKKRPPVETADDLQRRVEDEHVARAKARAPTRTPVEGVKEAAEGTRIPRELVPIRDKIGGKFAPVLGVPTDKLPEGPAEHWLKIPTGIRDKFTDAGREMMGMEKARPQAFVKRAAEIEGFKKLSVPERRAAIYAMMSSYESEANEANAKEVARLAGGKKGRKQGEGPTPVNTEVLKWIYLNSQGVFPKHYMEKLHPAARQWVLEHKHDDVFQRIREEAAEKKRFETIASQVGRKRAYRYKAAKEQAEKESEEPYVPLASEIIEGVVEGSRRIITGAGAFGLKEAEGLMPMLTFGAGAGYVLSKTGIIEHVLPEEKREQTLEMMAAAKESADISRSELDKIRQTKWFGRGIRNAMASVTQFAPLMLAGPASPLLMIGSQYTTSFGNTYLDFKNQGLSDDDALKHAHITAGIESAITAATWGLGFGGKEAIASGKAIATGTVKKRLSRGAAAIIARRTSEELFLEEIPQTLTNRLYRKWQDLPGGDFTAERLWKDVRDTTVATVMGTSAMSTVEVGAQKNFIAEMERQGLRFNKETKQVEARAGEIEGQEVWIPVDLQSTEGEVESGEAIEGEAEAAPVKTEKGPETAAEAASEQEGVEETTKTEVVAPRQLTDSQRQMQVDRVKREEKLNTGREARAPKNKTEKLAGDFAREAFGTEVLFYDAEGGGLDGKVAEGAPAVMRIEVGKDASENTQGLMLPLVGHEAIHSMKRTDPDAYNQFLDFMRSDDARSAGLDEATRAYMEKMAGHDISEEVGEEEGLAEIAFRSFTDPKFWQKMEKADKKGVVAKFKGFLVDTVSRAIKYFEGRSPDDYGMDEETWGAVHDQLTNTLTTLKGGEVETQAATETKQAQEGEAADMKGRVVPEHQAKQREKKASRRGAYEQRTAKKLLEEAVKEHVPPGKVQSKIIANLSPRKIVTPKGFENAHRQIRKQIVESGSKLAAEESRLLNKLRLARLQAMKKAKIRTAVLQREIGNMAKQLLPPNRAKKILERLPQIADARTPETEHKRTTALLDRLIQESTEHHVQEERRRVNKAVREFRDDLQRWRKPFGKDFNKMRPENRDAIRGLLADVTERKMSDKQRADMMAMAEAMGEHLSERQKAAVKMAQDVSLYDMQPDQIKALHQAVAQIVNQQMLFEGLKKGAENRALTEIKEDAESRMKKPEEDEFGQVKATKGKSRIAKAWLYVGEKLETLALRMDGGKPGPLHKVFFMDCMENPTDEFLRTYMPLGNQVSKRTGESESEVKGDAKYTNELITIKLGGKKRKIARGNLISLALVADSESGKIALKTMQGWRANKPTSLKQRVKTGKKKHAPLVEGSFTDEDIKAIHDAVGKSTRMLRIKKGLREFINKDMTKEFNRVFLKAKGYEPDLEPNYFMLSRHSGYVSSATEQELQAYADSGGILSGEGWGSLQERTGGRADLLIDNCFDVINNNISHIAQLDAFALPLRRLNALLHDPKLGVRKMIEKSYGPEFLDTLELLYRRKVSQVLGPVRREEGPFGAFIGHVRKKFQSAVLGANLPVWVLQSTSVVQAANELGFSSVENLLTQHLNKEEIDKVISLDYAPQLHQRKVLGYVTREVGEGSKEHTRENIAEGFKSRNITGVGMRYFDQLAIRSIVGASLAEGKKKGLSGEALYEYAGKRAQEVTRKTQPSWDMKDRTPFGGSRSELVMALNRFRSFRDQMLTNTTEAWLRYQGATGKQKKKEKRRAIGVTVNNFFVAGSINAVRKHGHTAGLAALGVALGGAKKKDKGKGEFWWEALQNSIGMLPLGDSMVQVGKFTVNGFDSLRDIKYISGATAPVTDVVWAIGEAAHHTASMIKKSAKGDEVTNELILDAIESSLESFSRITGVPLESGYRSFKPLTESLAEISAKDNQVYATKAVGREDPFDAQKKADKAIRVAKRANISIPADIASNVKRLKKMTRKKLADTNRARDAKRHTEYRRRKAEHGILKDVLSAAKKLNKSQENLDNLFSVFDNADEAFEAMMMRIKMRLEAQEKITSEPKYMDFTPRIFFAKHGTAAAKVKDRKLRRLKKQFEKIFKEKE